MKPEAQRIAIAEACGVQIEIDKQYSELWHWQSGETTGMADADLNAMQEAVKIFTYEQAIQYLVWLQRVVLTEEQNSDNPRPSDFACHNAAAAQRAEAFLRALNLYEESE